MGKTRRVVLSPEQCMTLYGELLSTTELDRRSGKALDALDDELGKIVNSHTPNLDGNVKFQRPEETAEADFSFRAMLGAKITLVQAIAGLGKAKTKATYGFKKYSLTPIVMAFGKKMVDVIANETKLKEGAEEDIDWDEEAHELEDNGTPEAEPKKAPEKESVSS